MENKQIERRNNNHPARRSFWQSVDAALARMCPAKEPNPRLSPAPCFTVPVAGQVVGQVCVCAVYDRPFLDRFERQASGLYLIIESRRIDGGKSGDTSGASVEIGGPLNVNELRGAYRSCPWCGENGNMRYRCNSCGGMICGGKVKGRMFHCRASCGAVWRIGHDCVHEIRVTEERKRSEWQAPARRGSVSQAPAIEAARVLLPPARRK